MQAKVSNSVQTSPTVAALLQTALGLEAILAKTGSNPVMQILQHLGDFYEWRDYPEGGVWDRASGYGYFYHAHPGAAFEGEHGHFHLFWAEDASTRTNLIALSMDGFGRLLGAFAANAWHLALGDASKSQALYTGFQIDLAYPCFAANQWLSAVVRGLSAQFADLHHRAAQVQAQPTVGTDRGRPVLLAQRIALNSIAERATRPAIKQMRR